MKWTNEHDEVLLQLWDKGYTMQSIARRFDVTRNAVAGRLFRLRAAGRTKHRIDPNYCPQTREQKNERQREKRKRRSESLGIPYKMRNKKVDKKPVPPRTPSLSKPVTEGVTILARRFDQCAYPIGNNDRLFCGAPVCSYPDEFGNVLPTSWCEYHWVVCHNTKGKAA